MNPSPATRVLTFDEFVAHSKDSLSLGNDPSEVSDLADSNQAFSSPTVDGEKVQGAGSTKGDNPLEIEKSKVALIGISKVKPTVMITDETPEEGGEENDDDIVTDDQPELNAESDTDFDDGSTDPGVDDTDREPGEVQ